LDDEKADGGGLQTNDDFDTLVRQASPRSILVEPLVAQELNDPVLTSSESSDTEDEVKIFALEPNEALFPGAAISAQDARNPLFRIQTQQLDRWFNEVHL
jgi:hypothetical protein